MSVPTTIQSNQVPLTISTDGGVTAKNVVCKRAWNLNLTTSVNSEETDCGIEKGLGATDWTMDFEGVVNTTPNSPTEMSAAEIAQLALGQTLVTIATQTGNGLGSNFYVTGNGYITDFAVQNSVGNLLAFTFTFNGVGVPDFTK